jgi:hypothetical protein
MHIVKCTCAEESPVQIQSPTHCNVIGRSIAALPPVIAQQYSSTTITVLRVHSRKKKNSVRLPKLLLLRSFNHA